MGMKRRDFLKVSAAAAGGALLCDKGLGMANLSKKDGDMKGRIPKRKLGRTGRELSVIGLGGIVVMDAEPATAAKVVSDAVEAGINYFDVAPGYGDAEFKLGPALEPFRDDVFLACKTELRDKAGAKADLDESLRRLKTGYFDLYQLHGLIDVEKDVKAALGKGGAMEAIIEAKKAGMIRHIGFSAHSPEAAMTAMREFDFDTILYPVNFCTSFESQFEQEVLAEAKKRGMGVLALKAMAKQMWQEEDGEGRKVWSKCWYEPISDKELARMALGWSLSQGATAALPPGEERLFRVAMELGPRCREITEAEAAQLEKIAAGLEPIFS